MQHQLDCPLSFVPAYALATNQGYPEYDGKLDETINEKPCPDRRCSTWLDLHTWFGFNKKSLSAEEFTNCFTDLGHGGTGIYERLTILGDKALELVSRVYISEKFTKYSLPFDLQRTLPNDMLRFIWTMKRVERVTSLRALAMFAKTNLSTAQSLPSSLSAARYLKACFGFSIQSNAKLRGPSINPAKIETMAVFDDYDRSNNILYDWATILIDNIYFSQKMKKSTNQIEDELVQDMQHYLGYPYDSIIPRIRNIICPLVLSDDVFGQAQTGRDIIQLYATEYFMSLAKQTNLENSIMTTWLESELSYFMSSKAIAIFAATNMNLRLILEEIYLKTVTNITSDLFERLFLQLVGACYSVTKESEAKKHMIILICRLRQIQVILHSKENDIHIYGETSSPLALFQGLDIYRWSSLSSISRPFSNHWLRDPNSRHLEAFLPISTLSMQRAISSARRKNENKQNDKTEQNTNHLPTIRSDNFIMNKQQPLLQKQNNDKVKIPIIGSDGTIKMHIVSNKKHSNINKMKPKAKEPLNVRIAKEIAKLTNGELYRPPFAPFMAPRVIPKLDYENNGNISSNLKQNDVYDDNYYCKINNVPIQPNKQEEGGFKINWTDNEASSNCTTCSSSESDCSTCQTDKSDTSEVDKLVKKMRNEQKRLAAIYPVLQTGKPYVDSNIHKDAVVDFYRKNTTGADDEQLYRFEFNHIDDKKNVLINN